MAAYSLLVFLPSATTIPSSMLGRRKSFIAPVLPTESLWRLKWHLKLFEILPSPLPPPHPSSELEQNGGPQLSRFPQGL